MVSAFITTRFSATASKDQAKPQSHMLLLTGRQLEWNRSPTFVFWWNNNHNLALTVACRWGQEVKVCVKVKAVIDQTEPESVWEPGGLEPWIESGPCPCFLLLEVIEGVALARVHTLEAPFENWTCKGRSKLLQNSLEALQFSTPPHCLGQLFLQNYQLLFAVFHNNQAHAKISGQSHNSCWTPRPGKSLALMMHVHAQIPKLEYISWFLQSLYQPRRKEYGCFFISAHC